MDPGETMRHFILSGSSLRVLLRINDLGVSVENEIGQKSHQE